MHASLNELAAQLRLCRHLVVLTGAGVSQESGIPTFRDALTGLWSQFEAERLATGSPGRRQSSWHSGADPA